jgi:formiminotetrahydrofolate cyclodeaminase
MDDGFLDRLAQPGPDPGGGAAAAHGGLLALAIMKKVALLEMGRTRRADSVATWQELAGRIQTHTGHFLVLRERDSAAYLKLADARASARNDLTIAAAWEEAIACPMSIMETAEGALKAVSAMGGVCARHLIPDLQVAIEFLGASFRAASHIARSNVALILRDGGEDRFSHKLSALWARTESELRAAREQLRLRQAQRDT